MSLEIARYIFYVFLVLALSYRIYDIFFGSLSRAFCTTNSKNQFYANVFHHWGADIARQVKKKSHSKQNQRKRRSQFKIFNFSSDAFEGNAAGRSRQKF